MHISLLLAHLNARSYFNFYVSQKQYEIKATLRLQFVVELDGSMKMATVVEIDRNLAKLHFEDVNRFEWIYLGKSFE